MVLHELNTLTYCEKQSENNSNKKTAVFYVKTTTKVNKNTSQNAMTQLKFTCSKSTTEPLEKGVKYV